MFENLRWLGSRESPYGVACLDCREFSRNMLSTTGDPRVAMHFGQSRDSTGEEYRGKTPPDPISVNCDLRYPYKGPEGDGPLFKASVMEDKWDIYLHDGYLYFVRSWTGNMVFRAKADLGGQGLAITSIEADAQAASSDPGFIVRQVDFLVKSHVCGLELPHPLPADLPDDTESVVVYSFGQYGRRASFATYEDTTHLNV